MHVGYESRVYVGMSLLPLRADITRITAEYWRQYTDGESRTGYWREPPCFVTDGDRRYGV